MIVIYLIGGTEEALNSVYKENFGTGILWFAVNCIAFMIFAVLLIIVYFGFFKPKKFTVLNIPDRILFVVWTAFFIFVPFMPAVISDEDFNLGIRYHFLSILFAIGITGGAHPYLATLIGMVYNYLPFVILPLYSTMLKLDRSQMEAAADLGASPVRVFISNVIPQSLPGIISAITMTLMPVMSSYVISDALSEGNITLIGNSIYLSFANSQWNNGSFTAFLLLILVLLTMWNTNGRKSEEVRGGLW